MKLISTYKESYSNHPKEIWALAILSLINRMGTMVLPFLSLYFTTKLDFSLQETGYLLASLGVGMFAGSYLGGKLCEWIGSRLVMILSLSLAGVFLISIQFFTDFKSLLLLMFLTPLFGEAYRPAMFVSVGNFVSKEKMARTMSLIRLMINLGMAMGPALGGYLATYASYSWLFWIDGLTCIIASLFLVVVSKHWKSDAIRKKSKEDGEKKKLILPPVYKDNRFLLFLLATFLMGFAFIQWFHTVPIFLESKWGFNEYHYGLFTAFSCALIVVVEMPLIHHIEKSKKIKQALYLGLFLIGISYLGFLLPGSFILGFVIIGVWSMGEVLHLPLNSSEAMNLSPENQRGAYMAYFWMTWSMTNVLSPIIGLNYAATFGFNSFWIVIFGITGLSLLLFIYLENSRALQ